MREQVDFRLVDTHAETQKGHTKKNKEKSHSPFVCMYWSVSISFLSHTHTYASRDKFMQQYIQNLHTYM